MPDPSAPLRLADRLRAARHRLFVGREAEKALFLQTLEAEEPPFLVLHIHGPGGLGKSTLLGEFAALARARQASPCHLDGRDVEASPEGFLQGLREALDLPAGADPGRALEARPGRHVLLVDTYEALGSLDPWLREEFLPTLPGTAITVLAGRCPPAEPWSTDPGWSLLSRRAALRNLTPDESRRYLELRGLPAEQREAVVRFTHGHPLALSLVADRFVQTPGLVFEPMTMPDLVQALLSRFLDEIPDPSRRAALEVAALVRVVAEPLLADVLETGEAEDMFRWMGTLSFVDAGPHGLYPQGLAREAVAADLRWRNPDRFRELHDRIRRHYTAHLAEATGEEQQRLLHDYVFLHRNNPVVRPFFEWEGGPALRAQPMLPGDLADLVAMVRHHEGEDSGPWAERWLKACPEAVQVFRDEKRRLAGFMATVSLEAAPGDLLEQDPATRHALQALERRPLRPGERALLFRFWMDRDSYQSVSPVQSAIFVNMVRHYLVTPGLAATFVPCADAGFWEPVFRYAGAARLEEADFEVGGRRYGVFGHDWRVLPPADWLAMLAEREHDTTGAPPPPAPEETPLVVLSREAFASAVHEALKHYADPPALHLSPLLQSRLVPRGEKAARVEALREALRQAADTMAGTPRTEKWLRAMDRTWFHPAPTQEKAAELLDLPFSTYRRYLRSALDRVVDVLWAREIGE